MLIDMYRKLVPQYGCDQVETITTMLRQGAATKGLMEAEELQELVNRLRRAGTDLARVEVKKAGTAKLPKTLKESVSAFANRDGGLVILGLDEEADFAATGVGDAAKLSADFASMCAQELEPPIRASIEIETFEDVELIVCTIEPIAVSDRPCFVKAQGIQRGSFLRVHDGDHRLSTYEVQVMTSNRGQPRDDEAAVEGAFLSDLDQVMTADFLARLRERRPVAFAALDDLSALRRARVITVVDGVPVPTVAGLLSLGEFPQEYFPQLNLTFVHHPTSDGSEPADGTRFIDNAAIDGPIPKMIVEAIRVLRRNMSRRAVIRGVGRIDVSEYPETALREAIVNACIHRDLSGAAQGMQVQIEMYPDRLTIKNPGGLYGPVTLDGLGEEGNSSSRNATLLRVLEDVVVPGDNRTVCENRGSGIRNMIVALRRANMSLPSFDDRVGAFAVTFPNHSLLSEEVVEWIHGLGEEGLTESQCVGLALMREGHVLNNESYRAANSVDSRVATAELGDLVSRGLASQEGGRRWAIYTLAVAVDLSRPRTEPQGRLRPGNRREEILSALGTRTMSRAEIEKATGLRPQTVLHWLRVLRKESKVDLVDATAPQDTRAKYRASSFAEELQRGQQIIPFD